MTLKSLFDIRGKRILITGSTEGLGLGFALGLGLAGAEIILNGRNPVKLKEAQTALRRKKIHCSGMVFDVTDPQAAKKSIAEMEKQSGPVDILINNAGITLRGNLETFSVSDWDRVIQTDLSAMFYVARAVFPGMKKRKKGKVINIASLMSHASRPGVAAYTAAKGGVHSLTQAMACEWMRHNIQVNAIGPGYFATEMTRPLARDPEFDRWVRTRTPAGRWGVPHDLVGTAIYLSSSASDFITGQIIYVDGGFLSCL